MIFYKGTKIYQQVKDSLFSKPDLTPYPKLNPKGTKALSVRTKTVKILETQEKVSDL